MGKKDFHSQRFAVIKTTQTQASRRVRWLALLAFILMLGSASVYIYFSRQEVAPAVQESVDRFKHWLAERKQHLKKDLVKVKRLAVTKNEAEVPIHYEFYSELPNMQMPTSVAPTAAVKVATIQKPASKKRASPAPKQQPIVDADDIEQELLDQLKQT